MRRYWALYLIASLILAATPAAADSCSALKSAKIAGVKVTAATAIPAGQFTTPQQTGIPSQILQVPAFCRVQLSMKPQALAEVWLPAVWNHKLLGLGNGGELGAIVFTELDYAALTQYVGVSSDLGHQSYSADASWALGHPELVKDFGYRATHDMTVAAKALTKLFYQSVPQHAYFYGASAGGRQALMEAERYPLDYNGVAALAPAQGWTHIASGMIGQALSLGDTPFTDTEAQLLNRAVIAACDGLDGLVDGLITDPTKCHYDPAALACKNPRVPDADCLNPDQVAAAQALYRPLELKSGKIVYGALPYGSEYEWSCSVLGGAFNLPFANSWYQYEVYGNPNWDFHNFDPDVDVPIADNLWSRTLNAWSPNFDAFRKAGGKLLIAQGQADAIVVPHNTTSFFRDVTRRYGADTANFARLFMEPGAGHCAPAQGPNGWDPVTQISTWVETDTAPNFIVAYHYDVNGQVDRSRPLCPYPQEAIYSGQGSIDDYRNFSCGSPNREKFQ
jgi:feruloyl esterase